MAPARARAASAAADPGKATGCRSMTFDGGPGTTQHGAALGPPDRLFSGRDRAAAPIDNRDTGDALLPKFDDYASAL